MHRLHLKNLIWKSFKGLKFAYNAAERGGNIPTAMNAANELAVSRFLDEKIKYLDIYDIIEYAMEILSISTILQLNRFLRLKRLYMK